MCAALSITCFGEYRNGLSARFQLNTVEWHVGLGLDDVLDDMLGTATVPDVPILYVRLRCVS